MRSITTVRRFTALAAFAITGVCGLHAQTPGKVATIEFQAAILQTKDGQKAVAEMQAKFSPVKAQLEAKKAEITKNEDTLRKGQSTMSVEAQQRLSRDIEVQTKALNRDTDDANADLEQENQRVLNELGGKMMAIINKYATDKGYVMVVDISSQQSPVLWASNGIDITRDIIAAYDSGAASLPSVPPASGAATRPATKPASGITKPR